MARKVTPIETIEEEPVPVAQEEQLEVVYFPRHSGNHNIMVPESLDGIPVQQRLDPAKEDKHFFDNSELRIKANDCACADGGYDGSDYFCGKHEYIPMCPRCHTVNTAIRDRNEYASIEKFVCQMCSAVYFVRMEDGSLELEV